MLTGPAHLTVLATSVLVLAVLCPASANPQTAVTYGGTVVVGLSTGDPDSLDPTVSGSTSAATIYPSFCQSLYERDARLQLIPVLAAALPAISGTASPTRSSCGGGSSSTTAPRSTRRR